MRYDAIDFLDSLFRLVAGKGSSCPLESPPVHVVNPDDLPDDWLMEWEERAAIREFDGGLPREKAEAEALTEIRQKMADWGPSSLYLARSNQSG